MFNDFNIFNWTYKELLWRPFYLFCTGYCVGTMVGKLLQYLGYL